MPSKITSITLSWSLPRTLSIIENVLVLRYYADVEEMPDNHDNTEGHHRTCRDGCDRRL